MIKHIVQAQNNVWSREPLVYYQLDFSIAVRKPISITLNNAERQEEARLVGIAFCRKSNETPGPRSQPISVFRSFDLQRSVTSNSNEPLFTEAAQLVDAA